MQKMQKDFTLKAYVRKNIAWTICSKAKDRNAHIHNKGIKNDEQKLNFSTLLEKRKKYYSTSV